MRVSATKTSNRVERNVYITANRIKGYGQNNDYPQKVLQIIDSSGTGKTCINVYVKFIEGGGFLDPGLGSAILNTRNERANSLLRKAAKDLENFNGFAFLVKYSGTGLPSEYYNIPFEQCRLEIHADGTFTNRVAVHHDWTNQLGKPFKKDDVKFIDKFNPQTAIPEMIKAGSPEAYLGQVMYFTADGDWDYPICPFDPIITDMLTEEGVSTVKYRNTKNNFLPAGILVRKGIKPKTLDDGTIDPNDPLNIQQEESALSFQKMQGEENASKIWVVDIDTDEEMPVFMPFMANNYDRQYQLTEQTVQENIGKMFIIPPILRGVDVGAGFGADLMTNAYNFMNAVTNNERRMIEVAFKDLLAFYITPFADFTVQPLTYLQ